MILRQDLRIGNYVFHPQAEKLKIITLGYIDCWTDILQHEELHTIPRFGAKYSDIYPIPLTEELLVKCGFEYFDNIEDWGYILGQIRVSNFNDEYFYLDILDQGGIDLKITSLHQLQNLYFAVTGKEFEIKL